MEMSVPKVYMLIGVPGSGKSTWVTDQLWAKDMPVVSSDRFIDEHAEKEGKTYNEVFNDYIKIATKLMENQVLICRANNSDFVWDQTNTSAKSRKSKLDQLEGYEKIAVVFQTPAAEEHARRLASRPGKAIPDNVMRSMIENLQMPTEEEGFSEIWYAQ
jgi:predicted kinase